MTILQPPVRHWHCPSCKGRIAYTGGPAVPDASEVPLHPCPKLGLTVPYVEVSGPDEDSDAIHKILTTDERQSVSTEHGDGSNDVTVYPGIAWRMPR